MEHWIHHATFLGNSVYDWIVAGIGALIGYIVIYGIARLLATRLKSLSEHHPRSQLLSMTAAVIRATRGWVILLLAIVIALHSLSFGAGVDTALGLVITILVTIQIGFWISTLILSWLKRPTSEGSMQNTNPIIYGLLTWVVELLVWVTLALAVLSSNGVHIGAFIASLGVGGIAIALAAKNVLQDLFASVAIGLDKPFKVGEFIAYGDTLGTVKKVGIRSTRLEALSGEEIAISNSDMLQQQTNNLSRRQERRVVFEFYVPLDTPRDKMATIIDSVNSIIDDEEQVRRDRGHFRNIARDGFQLEFVYFVLVPDMDVYCDIQQAFNLKIMEALQDLDVTFALPVQLEKLEDFPSYKSA